MDKRTSTELQYLTRNHRLLDSQLVQLTQQPFLTPDERVQLQIIKKKKLANKDRMVRLSTAGLAP